MVNFKCNFKYFKLLKIFEIFEIFQNISNISKYFKYFKIFQIFQNISNFKHYPRYTAVCQPHKYNMREKSSCARLNLRTLKYRKCLISLSNYLTVYHKKYAFFSFVRCFTHLLLVSDRYILPVTLLSVVINIPRFFEVNPVDSFVIIIMLLSEVNPA